jgi:hypothetical protein
MKKGRGNPRPSRSFRAGEERTYRASDRGQLSQLLQHGEAELRRRRLEWLARANARKAELLAAGRAEEAGDAGVLGQSDDGNGPGVG